MKIIKNSWFPFGNYIAINIFGIIFTKKDLSDRTINHENIHTAQMKEMLYIFFYLWYVIEWLIKLIKYNGDNSTAYYMISFEQEAYENESNLKYLDNRKKFTWIKFL